MEKNDGVTTTIIVIITIIVLCLSVIWTYYQWTTCMDVIGNTFYCLQHISN